jgi:hypothetical protein
LIEKAYRQGEKMGLATFCHDQAGPFQTVPCYGYSWQKLGKPTRHPHESIRAGTVKLMTFFHPLTGRVEAKGVTSCPNSVLHPWLKEKLSKVLESLPPRRKTSDRVEIRQQWMQWYEGLTERPTLPEQLPPLRALLIQDNLAGHKSKDWVQWCFQQGIALLYTPLGSSWLNMTESIQGIIQRRALAGQHPETQKQIIQWLEETADGWNQNPTPFIWGGKRALRRQRSRERRRTLAKSGACVHRIRTRMSKINKFLNNGHTHDK